LNKKKTENMFFYGYVKNKAMNGKIQTQKFIISTGHNVH